MIRGSTFLLLRTAPLFILAALAACSGEDALDDGESNACGALCGGSCVDPQSDPSNCGFCGTSCTAGQTCSNGSCLDSSGGSSSGGSIGTGGFAVGGTDGSGANSTGGAVGVGGASTGGISAGGSNAGGSSTGGSNAGGSATGGASTGGTSTGGSGSGGSGGSSCGVTPTNPNASAQAKKLLCYLYDISGDHVLSGQQETSWSNPEGDVSFYVTNVGKAPAVLGGDYLYPSGTSTRAIAYWNAVVITMIRYHMGAPPGADTYENSLGSTNIGNVLTNGTNEHTSFMSKLDYVAAELQKLEDANVPVLWAPFHEVQPSGWFWWSKGTASQFVQLWTTMFDYLTTTKGLNNLVWLMPFSGSPSAAWLPPKQYWDISGPDTYATGQPFASLYSQTRGIVGATVPIPLHETGIIPQPSQMFPNSAPWVLFSVWAGYQRDNNPLSAIQSAYASDYTITRDEVPNLK